MILRNKDLDMMDLNFGKCYDQFGNERWYFYDPLNKILFMKRHFTTSRKKFLETFIYYKKEYILINLLKKDYFE